MAENYKTRAGDLPGKPAGRTATAASFKPTAETTAMGGLVRTIGTACVAAATVAVLSFPVLTHLAWPGASGSLELQPRLALAASIIVAVFAIVLAAGLARLALNSARSAGAGASIAAGRHATPTVPTAGAATVIWRATVIQQLPLLGLLVLVAYPALVVSSVGWAGAIKWVDNFGVQILIYVMLAWGLNIVVGLAGLLDLGFIAFAAVGAYSYTLISIHVLPQISPGLVPFAFWICLPLSGILAAFWGVLLAFPVLRLRGDYLAIVTLAFGEMIRLVLVNWDTLTNGYAGLRAPRITFFGLPFASATGDPTFADVFGLSQSPTVYRAIFLYYVILALALLTAWVTIRLRRMPMGRAWEALREDEIACRSLGLNTVTIKLSAFAIGAAFGGMAGAFFAARQGFINPKSFEFMESATVLAIVVLGGMGSLTGCAIAAVVMIGGTEILRELDWLKSVFGRDFDPTQYRMLLLGLAMVVLMIWRPRGLISSRDPSIALKSRKAVSAALVKEGTG